MANLSDLLTYDEQRTWGAVLGDYYKQAEAQSGSSVARKNLQAKRERIHQYNLRMQYARETGKDLKPDLWEGVLREGWADIKADRESGAAQAARRWMNDYLRSPSVASRMRRQLEAREAGRPLVAGTQVPRVAGERGKAPRRRAQQAYQEDVTQLGLGTAKALQQQPGGVTPQQQRGMRGVMSGAQIMPSEEPLGVGEKAGLYGYYAAQPWVGFAESAQNLVLGAPEEPLPPPRSLQEAWAQSAAMGTTGPNLAAFSPFLRLAEQKLVPRATTGQVALGAGVETASAGGLYSGVGKAIGLGTRALGKAAVKHVPTLQRGVKALKKFSESQLAKSKAGMEAEGGVAGAAQRFISKQAVALIERMWPQWKHGIEAGVGFHALNVAETARMEGASEAVKRLGTLGLRLPDAAILISGGDPHSPVWKEKAAAENAGQRFPLYLTVMGAFDMFDPEGFAMLAAFPPAFGAVGRGIGRVARGRGRPKVAPAPTGARPAEEAPAEVTQMPIPPRTQGDLAKQFVMSDQGIPIPRNVIDAQAIKTYIEETGQLKRGILDDPAMRQSIIARGEAEGASLEHRLMGEQARSYALLVEGQLDAVLQNIRRGKIGNPNEWRPEVVDQLVRLAREGDVADDNTRFALQAINWLRYADLSKQASETIKQASGPTLTPAEASWDLKRFKGTSVGRWFTKNAESASQADIETKLEALESRLANLRKSKSTRPDTLEAYEGFVNDVKELIKRRFQPEAEEPAVEAPPVEDRRQAEGAPLEGGERRTGGERRGEERSPRSEAEFWMNVADQAVRPTETLIPVGVRERLKAMETPDRKMPEITEERTFQELDQRDRQDIETIAIQEMYRAAQGLTSKERAGTATAEDLEVTARIIERVKRARDAEEGRQAMEEFRVPREAPERPAPPGIEYERGGRQPMDYQPRSRVVPERYRGGLKLPAPRGREPGGPAGPFYTTTGTRGRGPTTLTEAQAGGLEGQPPRTRPTISTEAMDVARAEREAPRPPRPPAARGEPEAPQVRAEREREARVYSNPDYAGPEEFDAALRDARQRGDRKILQLMHAKIMDLANMTRTVPEVTTQREMPVTPGATSVIRGGEPVVGEPFETRTFVADELLPTPPADVDNARQATNLYRLMLRNAGRGLRTTQRPLVERPTSQQRAAAVAAKDLEKLAMAIDEMYVRGSKVENIKARGRELSRHIVEMYDQLQQQAETRGAERAAQRGRITGFVPIPGSELQSGKPMRTTAGEQRLHTEALNEYVDELYRRRSTIEDQLMHMEWDPEAGATTEVDIYIDRKLKPRVERLLPALPGGKLILRDGTKRAIPKPPKGQHYDTRDLYSFENQEFTIGNEKIPLHMVTGVEQSRSNLTFQGREIEPAELLYVLQKVRGEARRLREEGAKRQRPTMSKEDWVDVAKEVLHKLPDEALGALSGYMQPKTPASGTVWADFPSPVWGNSADYRSTEAGPNYNLQRAIFEVLRARARGEAGDQINKGTLPRGERGREGPASLEYREMDYGKGEKRMRGKMSGKLVADPYLNVEKSGKDTGFRGVHGKLRTFIKDFLNLNWKIPTHPSEPYLEATTKGFKLIGDYADMLAKLSNKDFDLARTDGEAMVHALDEVMRIDRTPGSAEDVATALSMPLEYVTEIKKALTKQGKKWTRDQISPLAKTAQHMLDIADRVARTREGTPWDDIAPDPEMRVETTKREREVGAFNPPRIEGMEDVRPEERATARETMVEEGEVGAIYELPGREISLNHARRILESALTAAESNPRAFRRNEAGEITDLTEEGQPGSLARLAQLIRDSKKDWNAKGELSWDAESGREAHIYATALKRYLERNFPDVPTEGLKKAYAEKGTPRADQLFERAMSPEHYAVSKAAVEQRGAAPVRGETTVRPRRYQTNYIARRMRDAMLKMQEKLSGKISDKQRAQLQLDIKRVGEATASILEYSSELGRYEDFVDAQNRAYLKYRRNLHKQLMSAGAIDVSTGEVTTSKLKRTPADMLRQEAMRMRKYNRLSDAFGKYIDGLMQAEEVLGRDELVRIGLGEGRERGANMLALLDHIRKPTKQTQKVVDALPIDQKDVEAVEIKQPGDTPELEIEAPAKGWAVEPTKVEWSPVFDAQGKNVSATHVLVRAKGGADTVVPADSFFANVKRSMQIGKPLDIEFLRVSPEALTKYARQDKTKARIEWDPQIGKLTDWRAVGRKYAKLLAYARAARGREMRQMEREIGVELARPERETE